MKRKINRKGRREGAKDAKYKTILIKFFASFAYHEYSGLRALRLKKV